MEQNYSPVDILVAQRRRREQKTHDSSELDGELAKESNDLTCDDLMGKFGPNYVENLTRFDVEKIDEVYEVCKETLTSTGPGRKYSDLRCRLIIYITRLTSG